MPGSRLPGWRRTASMGLARWRWRCAGPARDTCSASRAPRSSTPGTSRSWYPARPRRSRQPCRRRAGFSAPPEMGPRGRGLYDWAYLELADLDARSVFGCRSAQTLWTRGLLIRRSLSDGKMAFFTTWCPQGTPLAVLVEVEGRRWAIEDAFETAKTELGLAHNETRSWHGWHRHVSLVMLAFALLMVIRHKADTSPQKRPPTDQHKLWSDGPSRRSVVLPGV